MTNNSSNSVHTEEPNVACFVLNFIHPINNHVTFVTTVINAILSPVAVAGNVLVLAAIWKKASLRTPSYIILGGLAFTDICTGLITQTSYVLFRVASLMNNMQLFCVARSIAENSGLYFSSVSVANIAFMAIERWLHMTRRSLLTKRRVIVIDGVLLFLLLFLVLGKLTLNIRITWMAALSLGLFWMSVTSVAYFKVFQLISRHRNHIQVLQANELSRSVTPSFNNSIARYKRSVFTILYILVVFLISYLPYLCCAAVIYLSADITEEALTALDVCTTVMLASSSLNPLLYCWRMKDIREGIKQLTRKP